MKLFLSIVLALVATLSFTACGSSGKSGENNNTITFEKGKYGDINVTSDLVIPKDALFLDIRNDWERTQSRAKGSVGGAIYKLFNPDKSNKKLNPNFVDDVLALADNKSKKIILICRSGSRTKPAAKLLSNNGFTNVWQIVGGTIEWQKIKPNETLVNQPL